VVLAYFILSATYLFMTMREDIVTLMNRLPSRWRPLYKLVTLNYMQGEKQKIEQMAWWLALCLVMLMALLSGGVIPWIFGLMPSQAGWFSAVQGPYFLTGALTSAVAAVIVVAGVAVRMLHLKDLIEEEVFKGLSKMLLVLTVIYLWFILHEHMTAQYAGPPAEKTISDALLFGPLSTLFLPVLAILIIASIYLAFQALGNRFSLKATVAVSAILLSVLWVKRVLIVIPSLLYPRFTVYPVGSYTPTWVEYSIIIATLSFVALGFMVFAKIFPIMEIREGA
jgi:molybdopterin-containing oxidoreductase family membrane subunit